MYRDMTRGGITRSLLLFALPMAAGSLLQQLYNVADTLIVGQALGRDALAAVGSAFTLMTFLTSIFLGLAMGAGALFSIYLGRQDAESQRRAAALAFCLIGGVTAALTAAVYALLHPILRFLQVPDALYGTMRDYLLIIFAGLAATFLYNFFACLLRAAGNSAAPLWFLGGAAVLNVGLDLLFVLVFRWGVSGAAAATVIAQYAAGIGLTAYTVLRCRELLPRRAHFRFHRRILRELMDLSLLTCVQQSAMNFGILLVQRLVDSFGPVTMAAFAAAVKIDAFAYLPVQEFGNAFSTFTAQNYGAGQTDRLRQGLRQATLVSVVFSCAVSALVVLLARPLMGLFRPAGGDGGHCRRRPLPPHRGHVLRRYRLPLPAVRLLPCGAAPRHERGADGDLAGRSGGAGLRAGRSRGRGGHLGRHPHRLVSGGRRRLRLLPAASGHAALTPAAITKKDACAVRRRPF